MGGLVKIGIAPVAALCMTILLAFVSAWAVSTLLEPPLQKLSKNLLVRLKARFGQQAAVKNWLKA